MLLAALHYDVSVEEKSVKAPGYRVPDDINILIADHVIHHSDGKISALGLFQVIMVSKFPAQHRAMNLVIELSCGIGPQSWALILKDPQREECFKFKGDVVLKNYADKHNIVVQIMDMKVDSEGEWQIQFAIDDVVLKTRKFFVQKVNPARQRGIGGGH